MIPQNGPAPILVLEDDPTGTQSVVGVPVVFDVTPRDLQTAARAGPATIHALLNTRAYSAERAYESVFRASAISRAALPASPIVLRGDSTLRAHVLAEYKGFRDAVFPHRHPPLVLVPALPAAGRVTVSGVHYVEANGIRTPVHETSYATDGSFAYSTPRLLEWAAERSGGYFGRTPGIVHDLDEIRGEGPPGVARCLGEVDRREASVVALDAVTDGDVAIIADGLRQAWTDGLDFIVRASPALASAFGGKQDHGHVTPPSGTRGLLVVCGSHVDTTSKQLAELALAFPDTLLEVDILALASHTPDAEIRRAAAAVSRTLDSHGLAVLSTPRRRPPQVMNLASGERIAHNLARVVSALDSLPGVLLAKGGITSHVTAVIGLAATGADVVGPIADGVALWQVRTAGGTSLPYVIFPGNVGGPLDLLAVVRSILESSDELLNRSGSHR